MDSRQLNQVSTNLKVWAQQELKIVEDEFALKKEAGDLTNKVILEYKKKIELLTSQVALLDKQSSIEPLNIDEELVIVEKDLAPYQDENTSIDLSSPLYKFLIEKRRFLLDVKKNMEKKDEEIEVQLTKEKKGFYKALFDIGKKLVDVLDDGWAAMRSILPHEVIELVSPILIGSVGFIVHLGEGYEGAKLAYQAYKNESIGQRKTRILTSVLTFMLAGAGAGMSIAFVASAAGAAIGAGTIALFPVLIPGALTAIYGLSLWRQSYILHRVKDYENDAWKRYQGAIVDYKNMESQLTEIMIDFTGKSEAEKNKLFELSPNFAAAIKNLTHAKNAYEEIHQEKLESEAAVAFTTLEVAASALVLAGLALGIPAIVGAASFGAIPLALIVTGVIFAVGTKYFEKIDEDNHHKYSEKMRKWFVDAFEIFPSGPSMDKSLEKSVQLDQGAPKIIDPPVVDSHENAQSKFNSPVRHEEVHAKEKNPDSEPVDTSDQRAHKRVSKLTSHHLFKSANLAPNEKQKGSFIESVKQPNKSTQSPFWKSSITSADSRSSDRRKELDKNPKKTL